VNTRIFKQVLQGAAAYRILDSSPGRGGTWSAGGCRILAEALKDHCGTPVYVVYNETNGKAEHFVVKTKDGFLDSDGIQTGPQLLQRIREEMVKGRLSIKPFSASIRASSIPRSAKTSKALAKLLRDANFKCPGRQK
jgi:hypothetical protein